MPADPYMGGLLASIRREEEVVCPNCASKWTVDFHEELGQSPSAGIWPVDDNDLICGDCGTEAD